MPDLTRFVIDCPGCAKPLGVPPEAVGRVVHCPHCRVAFDLPRDPGTGGAGIAVVRARTAIPRPLLYAGLAVLLVGGTGLTVGGFLALRFAADPAAPGQYVRTMIGQFRTTDRTDRAGRATDDEWPNLPHAAVAGAALTLAADDGIAAERDETLARAWEPAAERINTISLILSLAAVAGGVAALTGRFYWLAILGSAAGALNVNNLCCLPGAMAGAFAVLVLVRDEGRAYFGK